MTRVRVSSVATRSWIQYQPPSEWVWRYEARCLCGWRYPARMWEVTMEAVDWHLFCCSPDE